MLACIAFACLLGRAVESMREKEKPRNIRLNAGITLVQLAFGQIFSPPLASLLIWIGGTLGKPPIYLSGNGWRLLVSVFIVLAVLDLGEYIFHRMQHRIPWLWAMHSLHHSDAAVNVTTAYRQFWLEKPFTVFIYAPMGFLFHADSNVLIISAVASWVYPVFVHANLRIGLSWLLASPQFHRIHHSTERKHYDRNFSGFLPLWDVLFGTYMRPEGFPDTGLSEGEPKGMRGVADLGVQGFSLGRSGMRSLRNYPKVEILHLDPGVFGLRPLHLVQEPL